MRQLVNAEPQERVDILRSWCYGLGVNYGGTDLDLEEKRPLPYTLSGISHLELREEARGVTCWEMRSWRRWRREL